MWASFLDFLLKLDWKYGVWVIIGGAIVWFYFAIKIKADRAKEIVNNAHEKISKLPCDKHKGHLDEHKDNHRGLDLKLEKMDNRIDSKLEVMNKGMEYLNKVLNEISVKMNLNIKLASPLTQIMSPLTLTDRGREKVAELGIERMIDDRWNEISSLIEEQSESKNPYDIHQMCINEATLFPEKFLSKEDIDTIKFDVYKNGDLLQSYMKVIAVIVRDRFFKERDIDISEVDKYDPSK